MLCQELYYRYCLEATDEAFQRFYDSTATVFLSFAAEKCQAAGNPVEAQDVVNRLYGILVSHAVGIRRVPIRALFSWCFGVISNMIKEEQRIRGKDPLHLEGLEEHGGGIDPLEKMIVAEETGEKEALYTRVMKMISTPNGVLSERQRRAMEMFYCEGTTLRGIARHLKVSVPHSAVLLFRARRKIAVALDQRI